MHSRSRPAAALALFAALSTTFAAIASDEPPAPPTPPTPPTAPPPPTPPAHPDGLRALAGDWLYVEDRTEGRPVDKQQPGMMPKFSIRIEGEPGKEEAVVFIRRDSEIRMALDGSPTNVGQAPGKSTFSAYSGRWKDGAFAYEIAMMRNSDDTQPERTGLIRTELRPTAEGGGGLLVRVEVDPPTGMKSLAFYQHPKDIALPTPAKGTIADVAWIAGAWVGTRGSQGQISMEERWSPPRGGAMLGVSRTVSRDRMSAFEFLRIVERKEGLVYIAQPNGAPPTEFVLTELDKNRAVFMNPRHDSPQRIVYELTPEGGLSASIGFAKGGKPTRFEFKPEASPPAPPTKTPTE